MNIGRIIATLARKAAPYVVPVIVGLVTAKAQEIGTKTVEKATRKPLRRSVTDVEGIMSRLRLRRPA